MITDIKNTREGINSRITKAEERTSGLEDRMMEITADKQNKGKNEESLRDLWDNIKCTNLCIIWVPKKREKGPKKIFGERTAEKFPNMAKETVNQVQEAQSPRQEKPEDEHTETRGNQTDKN